MSSIEHNLFRPRELKKAFKESEYTLFRGAISHWPAVKKWDLEYFEQVCPDISIVTKEFSDEGISLTQMTMKDYAKLIRHFKETNDEHSDSVAPYCHDVPIFLLAPNLLSDIGRFPEGVLPDWYAQQWYRYVQFFASVKNSITPLHFDTLVTRNIFFQVKGTKVFTIIRPQHGKYCYRKNWRWFGVDPENPDYERFPEFRKATISTVEVRPGDVLYMPEGTLHHVRSVEDSISFNIDFHTLGSALKSFLWSWKGMPLKNMYYNFQVLQALLFKPQSDKLFNRYKPYLNYIS